MFPSPCNLARTTEFGGCGAHPPRGSRHHGAQGFHDLHQIPQSGKSGELEYEGLETDSLVRSTAKAAAQASEVAAALKIKQDRLFPKNEVGVWGKTCADCARCKFCHVQSQSFEVLQSCCR